MAELKKELGFRDLVLFNIVAVLGLRWIAVSAARGYSSLVLWVLAFLCFLVPQVKAVRALTEKYPEDGGIYKWTLNHFGPFHGFVSGWCYWGNNLTYFPSLLSFTCVVFLYSFGQSFLHLQESTFYVSIASLLLLWTAVLFNIRGVKFGKWVQNIGAFGSWLTVLLLIGLGLWIGTTSGIANPFSFSSLFSFGEGMGTLGIFSSLCFAFAGFELAPSMAGEVKSLKDLFRAIIVAASLLTVLYILGTISVLVALPLESISLISGPIQAVQSLSGQLGLEFLVILAALFVTLGGFGGISAWLMGSARIPYAMGLDAYMPKAMSKVHPKYRTPHVSLLVQGLAASFFILISLVGSVVQEAYLFLLNATIIVYFIPYLYMFGAYYKIGAGGQKLWAMLGFLTTAGSIILSCLPPEETSSIFLYELKLIGSTIIFIGLGFFFYFRKKTA